MQEMMERKIPTVSNPWECNINGRGYKYPPGTTQQVPKEVAVLIDRYWAEQEKEHPSTAISFNELRDKPFYESTEVIHDGEIVIMDVTTEEDTIHNITLDVAVGDTVRVTWVNEEYVCSVVSYQGLVAFGNKGLVGGEDTGEPFAFGIIPGFGTMIIAADGAGFYYVKIVKETVHKIDPKFLPEVVGGGGEMVVNVHVGADNTATADKTYSEILEAIQAGKLPRVIAVTLDGTLFLQLAQAGAGTILFTMAGSSNIYAGFLSDGTIMLKTG